MSCHPADGPDGLDVGSGEGNAASLRQLLQQHVDQLNNNNLITENMYDKYMYKTPRIDMHTNP